MAAVALLLQPVTETRAMKLSQKALAEAIVRDDADDLVPDADDDAFEEEESLDMPSTESDVQVNVDEPKTWVQPAQPKKAPSKKPKNLVAKVRDFSVQD